MDLADNRTVDYQLDKKSIGNEVLIDGKIIPSDLREIYQDIVARRFEIYPHAESISELDYNYPSFDWASYHEYTCIEVFPQLKFLFPYIKECLEMVGDTDYDKYFFKSWINIWPKGQQIIPHSHYGVWHGYYVIKDTGTTTYYQPSRDSKEVVGLDNFDGHFTFMPAHLLHWATPNPQDAMRVSTGYNISTYEQLEKESTDNQNERGDKVRDVVVPLKDLL
tara:strand:- start:69 stop:731 length:663 start_codon:yes stop_codon:yes gene_type:complete